MEAMAPFVPADKGRLSATLEAAMLAGKSCELSSFSLSQQVFLRKLCREVYQMFRYGDRIFFDPNPLAVPD